MIDFVVNEDMFGKYAIIPTGFSKEHHIYKVIAIFKSNTYCEIPLLTPNNKPISHDRMKTVINVIHSGIDETEVIRVALEDCEIVNTENEKEREIRILRNYINHMPKVYRKRYNNAQIVRDILLAG